MLAVSPYGVHRDAFLYFSMGRHLRFWRMDFPPFIAVMANVQTALFGHSLAAARVFPAVEGTLMLVLAALMAHELGGGRYAQTLAMLPMLCGTLFLRSASLFQPVVLDQLWWTLALFALLRIGRAHAEQDARATRAWWLVFGVATGLGLLTKFSILFIGFSVLCALLATRLRAELRTRWPWIAAAIAFTIGSPGIVGQIRLGFPVVGQMHDLQLGQLVHVSYMGYILTQPLLTGLAAFLLAVAGAAALLTWPRFAPYRAAGWACVFVFLLLMLLHGKAYYVGPVYPLLIAAGAVWLTQARLPRVPALPGTLRLSVVMLMVAEGAILFPISVPVLAPPTLARYIVRTGLEAATTTNRGGSDLLPQDFADQLGWQRQAAAVARVYRALSPEQQAEAVVAGDNYGEAGALEFYAGKYGFPEVISGAGSFWYFGPGTRPGTVLIAVATDSSQLAGMYGVVRRATTVRSPWSVEEERLVPVWLATDPRTTLQQVWPRIRDQ